MSQLPLNGIRLVSMTPIWAGPFAETILADWGAEVIRVESLQYFPQGTRGVAPRHPGFAVGLVKGHYSAYLREGYDEVNGRPWNRSCMFNQHARNKLSCTMDVVRPKGREMFRRLIQVSDIFLESNIPSAMEKLDLGYDVISDWNPRIIMMSLSAFGHSGPYKYHRSQGLLVEAFSGGVFNRGYADRDVSTNSMVVHPDEAAGLTAAFILAISLHQRDKTGRGMYIDMAQVETVIPQMGEIIMDYAMNSRVQGAMGNRDPYGAVQGCYKCQGDDRWVCITIRTDKDWEGFCRASGYPDWTKDAKFSDAMGRWRNHDELDRRIEEWTRQYDHFTVMVMLQEEDVAAGPVEHPDDAYNDLQMKDRGFFEVISHPECGTHLYPGLHYTMSKTPNHIRRPPPLLGEHNEYVYKQVIGVSDDEYEELEIERHIGMDYVPDLEMSKYKPE